MTPLEKVNKPKKPTTLHPDPPPVLLQERTNGTCFFTCDNAEYCTKGPSGPGCLPQIRSH